jgi:hypothetical protein
VVLQFPTTLTPDKVIAAVEGAGSSVGICDWRPAKGGEYGTFSIDILPNAEIQRILRACSSPEDEYKIPPEFLRAFKGAPPVPKTDTDRKVLAVIDKVNGDASQVRKRRAPHVNGANGATR